MSTKPTSPLPFVKAPPPITLTPVPSRTITVQPANLRAQLPRKEELALIPEVQTELQRFSDYAEVFGKTVPAKAAVEHDAELRLPMVHAAPAADRLDDVRPGPGDQVVGRHAQGPRPVLVRVPARREDRQHHWRELPDARAALWSARDDRPARRRGPQGQRPGPTGRRGACRAGYGARRPDARFLPRRHGRPRALRRPLRLFRSGSRVRSPPSKDMQ